MKSTLIDAGPLIALFDQSDQYHLQAVSFLKNFKGTLFTTWPVITEASHLLSFSVKAQIALLEWINRGGLYLIEIEDYHIVRLIELSEKFKDVPMDLADATLIVAAETNNIKEIATIDSDFYVYRDIRKRYLKNIFIK
ncbi:MAG: pilus biogenesis protein [Bacteroidota bacterium]|nr:MAG: tRNA(fMet)-specific endonuclease VapC [Bacteroidetes bacterium OLB12]GIL24596.1 MAG: pilus biogenesis protein [Bacteroidota bacterium]HNR73799.1 PIN domain-containing protein [Cyclobacteriaceae bacterium]